jgi:hypothetical protein
MDTIAATDDPTFEGPPAKLLSEPLFWASAAFVRVMVGLAATFSMIALVVVWRGPLTDIIGVLSLLGLPGYILAALSLLQSPGPLDPLGNP